MTLNPLENRLSGTHGAEISNPTTVRAFTIRESLVSSMEADRAKLSSIPTILQAAVDQLPEVRSDTVALGKDFLNALKNNCEKRTEAVDTLAYSLKF